MKIGGLFAAGQGDAEDFGRIRDIAAESIRIGFVFLVGEGKALASGIFFDAVPPSRLIDAKEHGGGKPLQEGSDEFFGMPLIEG